MGGQHQNNSNTNQETRHIPPISHRNNSLFPVFHKMKRSSLLLLLVISNCKHGDSTCLKQVIQASPKCPNTNWIQWNECTFTSTVDSSALLRQSGYMTKDQCKQLAYYTPGSFNILYQSIGCYLTTYSVDYTLGVFPMGAGTIQLTYSCCLSPSSVCVPVPLPPVDLGCSTGEMESMPVLSGMNIPYAPYLMERYGVASFADCMNYCNATSLCVAVTYERNNLQMCTLFRSPLTTPSNAAGSDLGIFTCCSTVKYSQFKLDDTADDSVQVSAIVATRTSRNIIECASECAQTSQCQSYTFMAREKSCKLLNDQSGQADKIT